MTMRRFATRLASLLVWVHQASGRRLLVRNTTECSYASIWDVPVPTLEKRVRSLLVDPRPEIVIRLDDDNGFRTMKMLDSVHRYMSVVEVGRSIWFVWMHGEGKSHQHIPVSCWCNRRETNAFYRHIATDCDDRLQIRGQSSPCLRGNGSTTLNIRYRTAKNIALARSNTTIWGIGGKIKRGYSKRDKKDGHWHYYEAEAMRWTPEWNMTNPPEIFSGGINPVSPGCVELRPKMEGFCEYDGRFSIAERSGDAWLYARANTNPNNGGRHVSVAPLLLPRNETVATTRRLKWGRLQLLTFLPPPPDRRRTGGDLVFAEILSQPRVAKERADIYTAAVNDYRGVFLGLFSTTVVVKEAKENQSTAVHRAAILLAASCDGQNFSMPFPVVRGIACGHGEINDHAVDGFVGTGGNLKDPLYFYVHHGVPGTFFKGSDGCPFWEEEISSVHRLPNSHVVRYAFKRPLLHDHIRSAVAQLKAVGRCSSRSSSSPSEIGRRRSK